MKVINLNSKFELTQAQISFAESVIIGGEHEPCCEKGSLRVLMNEIPVFLVDEKTQEKYGSEDILGFYQHSATILGHTTPVIGLCLERIVEASKTDEELIILIAKVLIHEFAHAMMIPYPRAVYHPKDEFYEWMEEPMANLITLKYFSNYFERFKYGNNRDIHFAHIKTKPDPFDFVKDFISTQPPNYKLGLDLYNHKVSYWWVWRDHKGIIQKKTNEKQDWLTYVKANVGKTDRATIGNLFKALYL